MPGTILLAMETLAADPRPATAQTAPALMRAAVLTAPRTFEVREVPVPEPGPRQVRVRIRYCGVCHSNLSPWQGRPWFDYPFAPGQMGHEATGYIDELGAEVSGLEVGQYVAFLSNNAYAEYDVVDQDMVVPLPPELEDTIFLGEPLGCAMNIMRRAGIQPNDTVAIVGIGYLGAILVDLATQAGARVIAIARKESALESARQHGAAVALPMENWDTVIAAVQEQTQNRMCDVTIEVTGAQEGLDLATKLTAERSRLVIAGYHQDGLRQVDMQTWNWRGLDVINAHERDPQIYVRGIREAVDAVREGHLNPDDFITHRLRLDHIGHAFEILETRPEGFMKAVLLMQD